MSERLAFFLEGIKDDGDVPEEKRSSLVIMGVGSINYWKNERDIPIHILKDCIRFLKKREGPLYDI